jgi:hypothetical protein
MTRTRRNPSDRIHRTLVEHGASPDSLLRFDREEQADLLPYATLLHARAAGTGDLSALIGVYEWQEQPLAFLIDGEQLQDEKHLLRIRRRLAMRGDAPYAAVVRTGRVSIHEVSLDEASGTETLVSEALPTAYRTHTLAALASQRPRSKIDRPRWISDVILNLLDEAISDLIDRAGVNHDEAISLVGRALFARFLADRELLSISQLDLVATADVHGLFDTPESAQHVSNWLDDTFNGEFLPLQPNRFGQLPAVGLHVLGNIMRRAPGGQLYLEWEEDWAHLDFSQIPVGVLSQAYELYLRRRMPERQRKHGGFYTPSRIADLMTRAAFHALRQEGRAHEATVLDPAAGAGVFLLTSFRQLVAERWRHDGRRPSTETLRSILYGQVAGFDFNEPALRFAALGLYLLSIELDPDPLPVDKLVFEDLRERGVLRKVGEEGGPGSLGPEVDPSHNGQYDLVIGNPPWSSASGVAGWGEVEERVRSIAEERLDRPIGKVRLLPNEVQDLPFVWRAIEWAKPGGHLVFALHGRLLFQQHAGMAEARAALFSGIDVVSVINGADLRQTPVWPHISAPFCILFARNERPAPGSTFRFLSPMRESLNRTGALRVDANAAAVVRTDDLLCNPRLLKILFRGGPLDLEVFERVQSREVRTLREYWQETFGQGPRGRLQNAGVGYQSLRDSSPKAPDGERGEPATDLLGLPLVTSQAVQALCLDEEGLTTFTAERVHRGRKRAIYRAPLLLVQKVPRASAGRIRVSVSRRDVVYGESIYGYSAHGHPESDLLVRYLALVISSRPALWFYLVTSGEFGVERDVIEKATIDDLPIPPFEKLSRAERSEAHRLFQLVAVDDHEASWREVDRWVGSLFGLRSGDLQVLEDTLKFSLPFSDQRHAAQAPPSARMIALFADALERQLIPFTEHAQEKIRVLPVPSEPLSPWAAVRVSTRQDDGHVAKEHRNHVDLLRLADTLAASEVLREEGQSIVVVRLKQARFWTESQAQLIARRIVWEHGSLLHG